MPNHTPGPWDYVTTRRRTLLIGQKIFSKHNGAVLAFTDGLDPQAMANTRLITAAPELLKAAEYIIFHLDMRDSAQVITRDEREVLRSAIRKAKGDPC